MEDKLKSLLKSLKMNESTLSMGLGVVTVLVIVGLVFNVWKGRQYKKVVKNEQEQSVVEKEKTDNEESGSVDENGVPKNLPESYKVKKGDHLWAIAEKFYGSGYNWVDIAKANGLRNPGVLFVGQELKLPKVAVKTVKSKSADRKAQNKDGDSGSDKLVKVESSKRDSSVSITDKEYVVKRGDTLWSIAVRAYQDGYKWVDLARANKLKNPDVIEVGQRLSIPR